MGDRSPLEVSGSWQWASGLNGFQRHWRLLDWRKANGQSLAPFSIPCDDKDQNILYEGSQKERAIFEEAVSRWARDEGNFQAAREVLRATFWTNQWMIDDDWHVVDNILKMPEGPEKAAKMAAAKAESPLFFAACLEDTLCGT